MKKIITSLALAFAAFNVSAQTTATNFTATDCNSVSHTLFDELNSGKVVVLVWVMPCGMCNSGAKQAYDAAQSFATSNPGQVLYYLVDDLGDASCAQLASFATSNTIGPNNLTIFSNVGNLIKESDYGGSGMPHVVVMGGNDHQIYFNKLNGQAADQPGITTAINSALTALSVSSVANQISFSISPNPVNDKLTISYAKAVKAITLMSINGQIVREESYAKGMLNPSIDLGGLAIGTYTVRVIDAEGKSGIQKITKQ